MTDRFPESAPFSPLPRRRPAPDSEGNGSPPAPHVQASAHGQASPDYGRAPQGAGQPPQGQPLPQRLPTRGGSGAPALGGNGGQSLPRRGAGGRSRRAGRHRSMHRISVASDAPALVLAVPGWIDDAADLARYVAEMTMESCPGVEIRAGFLTGSTETLAEALEAGPGEGHARFENGPQAVVVPLLAGPHPRIDPMIATAIGAAQAPVMLASALGPHPLLAGALHDRLFEAGVARASRSRGLNISAGSTGVIVIADRGPQAIADAGVTTVLLASRLSVPAAPASLGDPASIEAAVQRLRETGAIHLAIAPCVIGPETDPSEFAALSASLNAPCAAPLGGHPAIAQLVAVRYGEALSRIAVASH
ncbi:MAG: sirohydrochlorin chelatase [Streptosporangiaceae bacterium]